MSTVTETPANPAFKYESYVESQLGKARSRIRLLDLAVAGLILVGGTLLYAVTMAFLDRVFELPSIVRQFAFGAYVIAALVFIGVALSRIVFRRVNPYYAALQVEHGLEDVKNSVVNWLDLRERELPAAIRNAVSQRAAKDLARADLDQLLSTRWTRWIAAVTGGLLLALIVLFFLSPPQFFSLLKRSFVPFTEGTLATRTQLTLLQPEGGDVTVAVGRAVTFAVGVDGRVPDAGQPDSVRLRYRYQPTDPYVERPLAPADSSRHWSLVLPAGEVRNGFWYTVAGGDAETPEYRVQVRSAPLVTGSKVTYKFRDYLKRPDQTSDDPNLEGVRGTKVTIVAQTNRLVRDGQLEFTPRPGADGKPKAATITPAQRVPDDPRALSFQQIVLLESGAYRVWFTTAEGEKNADPVPHTVRVLDDEAPKVVLTKPGQPVSLPANGTLSIEGTARDDFGLTRMTLKLEIDGQEQSKPYRPGKSFQFESGNYPLKLDYKDVLELEKLKQANGQPLQPGASIEYWLEATDNYDYPEPNIGKSERFKITISPPESDPEKKQEQEQQRQRQREKNEQQQHEQKQDQDLNQENQDQKDQSNRGDKSQNSDPSGGDNQGESDKNLEDQKKKIEDAIKEQEKQEQGDGKNDSKDQKENKESKGDGAQDQKENKESKGDGLKGDPTKDQKESKDSKGDGQKGDPTKDQKETKESQGDGQKGDPTKDQKETKDSKGDGQKGDPAKDEKESKETKGHGQKGDPAKDQKDGKESKSDGQKGDPAKDEKESKETKGDGQKGDPAKDQKENKETKGDGQKGDPAKDQKDSKESKGDGQKGDPAKDQKDSKESKGDGQKGDPAKDQKDSKETKGDGQKGDPAKDQKDSKETKGDGQKGDPAKDQKDNKETKGDGQKGDPTKDQKDNKETKGDGQKGDPTKDQKDNKDSKGDGQKGDPAKDQKESKDSKGDSQKGDPTKDQKESKETKGDGQKGDPAKDQKEDKDSKGDGQKGDQAKDQKENKESKGDDQKGDASKEQKDSKGTKGDGQKGDPAKDQKENKEAKSDDQKGDAGKDQKENKESKGDEQKGDPANDQKESKESKGDGQKGDTSKEKSDSPDSKKDEKPGDDKGQPKEKPTSSGGGTQPPGVRDRPPVDSPDPAKGTDANPDHQKKASDLQLEDIRKKVNKDVLKKANMTEAEFQEFVKAYESMLKRKPQRNGDEEKLADPKAGGGKLTNIGARQMNPTGKDDKTLKGGIALPPPEYRDVYKEFSEKISGKNRDQDKK